MARPIGPNPGSRVSAARGHPPSPGSPPRILVAEPTSDRLATAAAKKPRLRRFWLLCASRRRGGCNTRKLCQTAHPNPARRRAWARPGTARFGFGRFAQSTTHPSTHRRGAANVRPPFAAELRLSQCLAPMAKIDPRSRPCDSWVLCPPWPHAPDCSSALQPCAEGWRDMLYPCAMPVLIARSVPTRPLFADHCTPCP
jgi:hypothetical protein